MKIHIVAVGDEKIASTRVRVLGLARRLQADGHSVSLWQIRTWLRHLSSYLLLGRPDVLVFQKTVPPPTLIPFIRRLCKVLIVEIDDAIHLGYPGESPEQARRRWEAIKRLLGSCDLLTTPSPVLHDDFSSYARAALIHPGPAPDVVRTNEERASRLLWLGSPSTDENLSLLGSGSDALRSWTDGAVAVGGSTVAASLGFEVRPWSFETQAVELRRCTLGVMPQKRSAWHDRKSAYKVLEYAAHGIPTVASDSPSLDALGEIKSTVRVVTDQDEWMEQLNSPHALHELPEKLQALASEISQDVYYRKWCAVVGDQLEGR